VSGLTDKDKKGTPRCLPEANARISTKKARSKKRKITTDRNLRTGSEHLSINTLESQQSSYRLCARGDRGRSKRKTRGAEQPFLYSEEITNSRCSLNAGRIKRDARRP